MNKSLLDVILRCSVNVAGRVSVGAEGPSDRRMRTLLSVKPL